MNSRNFVRESNLIEGIDRDPTQAEVDEFERFMRLDVIVVGDLQAFVSLYQPNAQLRLRTGLDVIVGRHVPPPGGPAVLDRLDEILVYASEHDTLDGAYKTHIEYETLHPFTDCNGRSGRMLWAWQVGYNYALQLGFLHRFYYQALGAARVSEGHEL